MKNPITLITNFIYGSSFHVGKFKKNNPNVDVLVYGATKARKSKTEIKLEYGTGWVASRRGTLILTNESLVCGDWSIPLNTIKKSEILQIKSFYGKAFLIIISTMSNEYYQFGLMADNDWLTQEVLPLTEIEHKFKYSMFSKIIRLCAVIWVLKLVLDTFLK